MQTATRKIISTSRIIGIVVFTIEIPSVFPQDTEGISIK